MRVLLSAAAVLLAAFLSPPPAEAQSYLLAAGDKIHIQVEEWPQLSGEFTVNAARGLLLPAIGEITVADKTPQQLAAEISATLARKKSLSSAPIVSAEVSVFRPFFIQGDVQKAGEYPFRPNLSVLQAISVAGGYYRASDISSNRFERDAILARGDFKVQTESVNRLMIREARLNAERSGTELALPPALSKVANDESIRKFMADDANDLKKSRAETAAQKAFVQQLIDLYNAEIASLRAEIAAENRQLYAIRAEGASLDKLAEKGLVNSQRRLTTERAIAQTIGTIQALETTIVRTQESIVLAQEREAVTTAKRGEVIDLELRKLQEDLASGQTKAETARQLVVEAEQIGPAIAASHMRPQELSVAVSITRKRPGQSATTFAAALGDPIEPDDTIVVSRASLLGSH